MSFDLCGINTDEYESYNDLLSQIGSDLSSHWRGRQITVEDAITLYDAIQDKVVRFLFAQDPNGPSFEKLTAWLARLAPNPPTFSFVERAIAHLVATPDGLRPQDCQVYQAGLRKIWKKYKTALIVGAVALVIITAVVVVTVVTHGTGSQAAVALGSAAISGVQNALEDSQEAFPKQIPTPVPSSPVFPPISDAPLSYKGPLFLEDGVLLNGEHYAYWEFLQKTKQEEFFINFLNAPKSTSTDESTPLPSNSPPYQPIPPQPGSSFFYRFFETFGHEILGSELIAEIPLSDLQKSHLFTTAGERSSSCQIGGINGINTPLDYAVGHADYIGELAPGQSIDWVYNNSHGVPTDFFLEVPLNYSGISPNTENLLTDNWVAFHEKNKDNPKARYLQFCHSQGAIHVKNALAYLPQEIRDRIIVVAIAPATVVPGDMCFQSFNYASKKDIVPFGELLFAGAFDTNELGTTSAVERALENRKELILLDPHPDAKGIDHDFRSPTFKTIIADRIKDYMNLNGGYE